MGRWFIASLGTVFLGMAVLAAPRPSMAQTWQAQFVGEFFGNPATVELTLEREGTLFQVIGEVQSLGRVYHFTADGWSGVGRMVAHPVESESVVIQLSDRRRGFALRVSPDQGGPIFYFDLT
ncbi:MAG: hypothetical protein H6842_03130 [Rhodospirillaceae bacterium]|nr:hypothetical protein [Rhodospirillaceae bacterium]